MNTVLRSATLLAVGHLAVAWNEEMVFRGYGFETVREALGQGKAVALLIPGFALYHGLDPQQLPGMLAGGTTPTRCGCQSATIGPGMCSKLPSLASPTPHHPSGPSASMAPSAGWASQGSPSSGCSARWFIL